MTAQQYIAFSVASMNALATGNSPQQAYSLACAAHGINDEFLIVARCQIEGIPLHQINQLPDGAKIVWRGKNILAQTYNADAEIRAAIREIDALQQRT